MAERLTSQTDVSLHANEANFFAAVMPPFEEDGIGYDKLHFMSVDVRYLGDGRQIFVYDREAFGDAPEDQERELRQFVCSVAKPLGIVPDEEIHPINTREAVHG